MSEEYELQNAAVPSSSGRRASASSTVKQAAQDPFATRPNSFANSLDLIQSHFDNGNGPNGTTSQSGETTPAGQEPLEAPMHGGLPPPTTESSDPPLYASSLPPMDGGRQAWLFLLGATIMEILIFGIPFSIGILHNYWTSVLFEGRGAEGTITLAVSLQSGLLYLFTALVGPVITANAPYRMHFQIAGLVISAASMVAAAFVTEPWHLVVTVGIFYPFAGATYLPCATLLFEWFSARRGAASGIMYSGSGIGGCLFPFIIAGLLDRFGYKTTMLSLGIAYGVIGGASLIPIRRRIPLSKGTRTARDHRGWRRFKSQWAFAASWSMFLGCMIIVLIGLGNFIPSVWIPSYADDLKMTNPGGTALIAMMNAASVPGTTLLGFLSDRLAVRIVIFFSCLATALSCFLLWGFGTHAGPLVAFSLFYGLFGLSFAALWAKIISTITKDEPSAIPLVFSVFAFLRGIGNITSGPISEGLLKLDTLKGAAGAYGFRNYGVLILFTGLSILSSGITSLFFQG